MKLQQHLALFPPRGLLEFIAIKILRPFFLTGNGSQYAFIISDSCSKLTWEIPTLKKSTSSVAMIVFCNWTMTYDIPSCFLANNGPQFVARILDKFCVDLDVQNRTTTVYHLQTNCQSQFYNEALVKRLRHYNVDHQKTWGEYDWPLTYAYNMPMSRSTKKSPFSLVLPRQTPLLSIVVSRKSLPSDAYCDVLPHAIQFLLLARMKVLKENVNKLLVAEQDSYKYHFDKNVIAMRTFEARQYVYINKPLRTILAFEA